MNTSLDNLTHKMQRAALGKIVDVALSRAEQDREKTMCQLVDAAKQFYGSGFSDETYENAKKVLTDPNSKWTKLINCVLDQTDPHVARTTALNLGYEAFFRGTKMIRENRVKYQCNIPWLILFDPTSACNMHCVGCWAGEYGHKNNLSFEDMDKIVTQGKELGVYLYMLTGGEPLVRKKDVLKLAEKHNDVQFAIYTNSTLIDEPFCEEVQRLGNIAFMLSIEGTPETNDARRGEGHYAAVMHAMDLLKEHGILFGTSICYTRDNIEAVTSDEFMRFLCDKGAHFAGLTYAAADGETVTAPQAGNVVFAGTLTLTGGTVVIDHGCGVKSYLYGLETVGVERGQSVSAGDPLGTAGTAHNLIYELRIGSKSTDPQTALDGNSGLQFREAE